MASKEHVEIPVRNCGCKFCGPENARKRTEAERSLALLAQARELTPRLLQLARALAAEAVTEAPGRFHFVPSELVFEARSILALLPLEETRG